MSDSQQEAFQARLARIGGAPKPVTPGPADNIVQQTEKRTRNFVVSEDTLRGRLAYPLSFVWAFLLGILSVFMARFAVAHLVGSPEGADDMMLYMMDIGIAGIVAFAIGVAIKSTDPKIMTATMLGVFATVTTMHNLVWMFPETFVWLYGEEWVEALLLRSEPSSLFFRGEYILIE